MKQPDQIGEIEARIENLSMQSNLSAREALSAANRIVEEIKKCVAEEHAAEEEGSVERPDVIARLYGLAAKTYLTASNVVIPEEAAIVGAPAASWTLLRDRFLESVGSGTAADQIARRSGLDRDVGREQATAHVKAGLELRAISRFEDALGQFRLALTIDPNGVDGLAEYGRTAFLLGMADSKKAVDLITKALDRGVSDALLYRTLGNLYSRLNETEEAIAVLRQGIKEYPEDSKLHVNLGNLLWLQSDQDEAIRITKRAVDLAPDLAMAKNNLAYYLSETGRDLDRAQELIDQALAETPHNPYFLDTRATLLIKRGDRDGAIATLHESLSYANRAMPHLHLAVLYAESEETRDDAVREAKLALQLADGDEDMLSYVKAAVRTLFPGQALG